MVQVVDHRRQPIRLLPRNRAPTVGEVDPPVHFIAVHSAVRSDMWVGSLIRSHTRSVGACTCSLTSTVAMGRDVSNGHPPGPSGASPDDSPPLPAPPSNEPPS